MSDYKTVWLVGAGPGDPDLITVRGQRLLGEADVVLHDALSHKDLLDFCLQAEVVDVGKRYGKRAMPQPEITELILKYAREGRSVLRLKGGDPFIFARGSEEALALAEAQIPFEIVPGITSAVAASAFAGISLTHRDLSSSVTLITGSDKAGEKWSPDAWEKLATATGTICVYMGMRHIREISEAIIKGGRDPQTPTAVVRWGARPNQRTVTAPLCRIADVVEEAGLSSPSIIFVGEVVRLRQELRWFDNRPLFGKKILLARPVHQAKETVRVVRARGGQPIVQPAIEIESLADTQAFKESLQKSWDWVVLTSANGVRSLGEYLKRERKDARVLGSAKVAVIGPKTAHALRGLGIEPDLVAKTYVAETLAEELIESGVGEQSRVLLLRAEVARDVLIEQLRKVGAEVEVVSAYRTSQVEGEAARALAEAAEESDIILLTSSSMVQSLVSALGASARSLLANKTLLSIGPVTSETLRELGFEPQIEASEYTIDGALDALAASFDVLPASRC